MVSHTQAASEFTHTFLWQSSAIHRTTDAFITILCWYNGLCHSLKMLCAVLVALRNRPHKHTGASSLQTWAWGQILNKMWVCVRESLWGNSRTFKPHLFVVFPSTVKFKCFPKSRPFDQVSNPLYTNTESPPPAPPPALPWQAGPFAVVESSLCPSCLDREDVHGAGAKQGIDGDLLRHIKGCIINITILFPPSTSLELPACFWQMLTEL